MVQGRIRVKGTRAGFFAIGFNPLAGVALEIPWYQSSVAEAGSGALGIFQRLSINSILKCQLHGSIYIYYNIYIHCTCSLLFRLKKCAVTAPNR